MGGRHHVDFVFAQRANHDPDQDVKQAGDNNTGLHGADNVVRHRHPKLGKAAGHLLGNGKVGGDVAEAGAIEQRDEFPDAPFCKQERDDRAHAGDGQYGPDVETT